MAHIGPYKDLLINIFLCDVFPFCPDLDNANYADDKTPNPANKHSNLVL